MKEEQIYLHSTPEGIKLIEGDKMPVMPERDYRRYGTATEYVFKIEYGKYEAAIQAAKASSVLVQDQEKARKTIIDHLKEMELQRCRTNRGSVESPIYSVPRKEYMEIKRDTIYGPFNIRYEIKKQWKQDQKNEYIPYTVEVAILHDTPEKEESQLSGNSELLIDQDKLWKEVLAEAYIGVDKEAILQRIKERFIITIKQ